MKFFLDKDIIMRYGRRLLLDYKMPKKQLDLMKEIRKEEHKVWISSNTPFAVLNHLKYRAQDRHGLDKTEEESEEIAKNHYSKIFGKGDWNIINLTMQEYQKASEDQEHHWEDAVQYQCALKTNKKFCTDNIKDFKDDEKLNLIIKR